jgi:hypothetical protein
MPRSCVNISSNGVGDKALGTLHLDKRCHCLAGGYRLEASIQCFGKGQIFNKSLRLIILCILLVESMKDFLDRLIISTVKKTV